MKHTKSYYCGYPCERCGADPIDHMKGLLSKTSQVIAKQDTCVTEREEEQSHGLKRKT
jgi:hypothetical protein